jgi:uncharacterized protein (AIM24 family)
MPGGGERAGHMYDKIRVANCIREAKLKYRIIGDTGQTVAVELTAGEAVFGRLGTLLFVKGAVKSDTNPSGPYWATLAEALTPPDEIPIVVYRCEVGGGLVGFRAPAAGRIHPLSLDGSSRIIARRKAIVAASEGIRCDRLHLEGEDSGDVPAHLFVTLSGNGQAFLHGTGNLVDFTLGPNERMVVDGEMILAMEGEIDYTPKPVGNPSQETGLPYILLMHLGGPGRVILNTLKSSA